MLGDAFSSNGELDWTGMRVGNQEALYFLYVALCKVKDLSFIIIVPVS